MKCYEEFHGNLPMNQIGKRLREIIKIENKCFKVLTGYGSTCGKSQSKINVIKSLSKMKKEGLISDFLPGGQDKLLLDKTSPYYDAKLKYGPKIKNDVDKSNDGIIFVFVSD